MLALLGALAVKPLLRFSQVRAVPAAACPCALQAGEGAAGGSSEGAGMDEDPSLTEEEDNSDSEPHSEWLGLG